MLRESAARFLSTRRVRLLVLGILAVLAGISAVRGCMNALERSQDLQWSGTEYLLQHVDSWAVYLSHNPKHPFPFSQTPNYLPVLYVLIAPIGLMSLEWAKASWLALNLLFALLSVRIAAKFYRMRREAALLLYCLMFMATPTRVSIGNGQTALLVLMLWCVGLLVCEVSNGRAVIAGISYFKFNFAPAVFFYLLFRRGIRAVVLSLLPNAAALVAVWLWVSGRHDARSLSGMALEPLWVSRTGYYPTGNEPNLMDVIQGVMVPFLPHRNWMNHPQTDRVMFPAAFAACILLAYWVTRRVPGASVQWQVAVMATASYGLFKHHFYDSVILLLPLAYALRLWRRPEARRAMAIIGFFWYAMRWIQLELPDWFYFVGFGLMVALGVLLFRLQRHEGQTYDMRVMPALEPAASERLN